MVRFTALFLTLSLPLAAQAQAKKTVTSLPLQEIFRGHKRAINSISFSPDGKTLATGGFDGTTRLWDVQSGLPKKMFNAGQGYVSETSWSADGRVLCEGHWNGAVVWWDVRSGKQIKSISIPKILPPNPSNSLRVTQLNMAPNNSRLLVEAPVMAFGVEPYWASIDLKKEKADQKLQLRQSISAYLTPRLKAENKALPPDAEFRVSVGGAGYRVALSPDGKQVLSTTEVTCNDDYLGLYLVIWDVRSGAIEHVYNAGRDFRAYGWGWSPDGKTIAANGYDAGPDVTVTKGEVRLWDVATGAVRHYTGAKAEVRESAFSPDGQFVVGGGMKSDVTVWNVKTGSIVHQSNTHTRAVYAVTFSPRGDILASADDEGIVQLRHFPDGRLLHILPPDEGVDLPLGFSTDFKTLISIRGQKSLHFWNAVEGKLVRSVDLDWNPAEISEWRRVMSPNGRKLAIIETTFSRNARDSRTQKKTQVRLYDVETGKSTGFLASYEGYIPGLKFSADSAKLIISNVAERYATHLSRWGEPESQPSKIEVWDIASVTSLWSAEQKDWQLSDVAFSPDGTRVACGRYKETVFPTAFTGGERSEYKGEIQIRDAQTGTPQTVVARQDAIPASIAFLRTRSALLCNANDQTRVWNIETGSLERSISGIGDAMLLAPKSERVFGASEAQYSQSGEGVLSSYKQGWVNIADLTPGWLRDQVRVVTPNSTSAVVLSPDERFLALSTSRGIEIREGFNFESAPRFTVATVPPALVANVPELQNRLQWVSWDKDGHVKGTPGVEQFLWPFPTQTSGTQLK